MKRDIYQDLLKWKTSERRKPLLLKGARQTGKTYILKEFGQNEYKNVWYFNFEEDPLLSSFFEKDLNPHRIITELSLYAHTNIQEETDLIIFDEIQNSHKVLNSLKYFQEKANNYHIATAGSLLGISLSHSASFPVGKVNFLNLYPMTFFEFLDAIEESQYRNYLENISDIEPISTAFHENLIDFLKKYYFLGGMPEVIRSYKNIKNFSEARNIQNEIIKSYILDFAKHTPANEIPKLNLIWNSIPTYLARENKKFIFSSLKKGARSRDYENALLWLENAGLIIRAYATKTIKTPLKHFIDHNSFKIYVLDVGLLGALSKIPIDAVINKNRILNEYDGAFAENYFAEQLTAKTNTSLHYWKNKQGTAEVDFLYEKKDTVIPVEIKAGINTKSKSLQSFDQKFSPPILSRSTLLNFKQDNNLINIPLYAVNAFEKYVY